MQVIEIVQEMMLRELNQDKMRLLAILIFLKRSNQLSYL
jgi:hypothetical protein